ncbi:MAG: diguanylate cyclase [Oleiphilaceae bacterium]|jgi:diguanylate cyclase
MSNTDDISKAIALLKQTLPEMNKRNIPTTPDNYAIWYEYVSGKNTKLVDAIHVLDKQHASFSDNVLRELYITHIANAHQAAVNQLSASVKKIINDFLTKIASEGEGLSNYAHTLSDFSKKVEGVDDINDIKHLISHILEETQKQENSTQNMQTSLEKITEEMKSLRAEVAKLNAEATTDSLTKINNRRAFDMEVDNCVSNSKLQEKPLCILFIDLDHFKIFNQKFSHTIGDKVLRFVATLLKNNIKGSDFVARFSGEQFIILLPETEYTDALIVAENIRDRLSKQTLSDSAEKIELGTITASIGVADYKFGTSAENLIRTADKCMREAKRSGRNQVVGEKDLILSNSKPKTHLFKQ